MDQKAILSGILLLLIYLFSNTVKFFIERRSFIFSFFNYLFCSCLTFSNLFDINFIDSRRFANCFLLLIYLLLLESANLWISLTSLSKFLKQLNKIITQSSDLRLSLKTSPSVLGVSNNDTSRFSSLCHFSHTLFSHLSQTS